MGQPKFRYRLQKVLDLRQRKEDQLKLDLAAATRLRDSEVVKLNQMVDRRQKAQKALEGHLAEGAIAEVQMTNDFIQAVTAKVDAQNRSVARASATVEETRKKLLEASKERQIMEKHKEKQKEVWMIEQKKLEAKVADEQAGNIFNLARRKREEDLQEEARYEEGRAAARLKRLLLEAKQRRR